jgi:hypothetical protein
MKKLIVLVLLLLIFLLGVFSSLTTQPRPEVLNEFHQVIQRYRAHIANTGVAVLIDYDQPLIRRRLWVIDMKTGGILLNAHVAHSMKSGLLVPHDFSNDPKSYKSCRGAFVTGKAYQGRQGFSLQLNGLDRGINDNASKRAIIFHGRYRPWSLGTFITAPLVNEKLINLAQGGAFVWVHANEQK